MTTTKKRPPTAIPGKRALAEKALVQYESNRTWLIFGWRAVPPYVGHDRSVR